MKASELNTKTVGELNSELLAQLENQFRLRIKKATGQLSQAHEMKVTRRTIARIKTVLKQKSGDRDD